MGRFPCTDGDPLSPRDALRRTGNIGTMNGVASEPIAHEDVTTVMLMMSDIQLDVARIRYSVEGGEDGEEEGEETTGDDR